jgi:GcrA cell cycle regulator
MMIWPAEHIETLRGLWPTYTATQITAVLNASQRWHCYTRCAVLGKAFRLGLPKKACPPARSKKHKTERVTERKPVKRDIMHPKPVPLPKVPPVPLVAKNLSIMELTSTTCRWPIGDPRNGMAYCGCIRLSRIATAFSTWPSPMLRLSTGQRAPLPS